LDRPPKLASAETMADIGSGPEQCRRGLAEAPACPVLRKRLARLTFTCGPDFLI
jgi:hypothetical protein